MEEEDLYTEENDMSANLVQGHGKLNTHLTFH